MLDDGHVSLEQRIQATLDERWNRRLKRRQESGVYRVCAAHNLPAVFEKAFALAKDAGFVALVHRNGPEGGEEWTGLAARPICGSKAHTGKRENRNKKDRR
ncbi:hypothetical protein AUEXF2481DRAFT_26093 [Aureobasidium subglaciale EXF-2481]|uniref:Uncharacterized protein n=1 Tax=Aureobasidium subglaciale (strain EXF-2481) TaxID=1043005 RepID=A0A074YRQ8_AURSE|nr:uncharacterized protein AUEXF2481DRAFT_26093 [Aureobasidium subglaciale EXF-2481]KEQ98844.1 hypothetical protein AUEXF2481DRAFT_26093 [Aureobasidium subglaciale EXF-2481]